MLLGECADGSLDKEKSQRGNAAVESLDSENSEVSSNPK
jgi:hypothetical protein